MLCFFLPYNNVNQSYTHTHTHTHTHKDCSPPSSPVHGILQARILEWVAIPFSRGSSQLRDWSQGVYIYISSPSWVSFLTPPSCSSRRSSQSTRLGALCYIATSHYLFYTWCDNIYVNSTFSVSLKVLNTGTNCLIHHCRAGWPEKVNWPHRISASLPVRWVHPLTSSFKDPMRRKRDCLTQCTKGKATRRNRKKADNV